MVEGDCDEALAELPPRSADAVVCDPPYGIGFQGERWDGQAIREAAARRAEERMSAGDAYQAWCRTWAGRCLEVLKPGAHLAAFGSPRNAHRLACALEEAGFELRDTLIWLYGTGLPKSRRLPGGHATSLKPAYEPILLARRPPEGALERNLKAHGTGALNADACRVDGRFPANVLLSHAPDCRPGTCAQACAARLIDAAADGTRVPSGSLRPASRLFYCPKAGRAERDAGCEDLPRRRLDLFPNAQAASYKPPPAANTHPTVKPLALMRWLVRLMVPPDRLVLDPFCGSGSTGCAAVLEGRRFLGIELEPGYAEIARARIAHWAGERTTGADAEAEGRGRPFRAGNRDARVSDEGPTRAVPSAASEADTSLRLDAESVEAIARRVAELLAMRPELSAATTPRRLVTAAEVSEWWGVERSWVYAHADELGARRLGAGERPRLRFYPDEVAERLAALSAAQAGGRRSSPIAADSGAARFRARAELWSPGKRSRPGGAATPPATAPKSRPAAR